MKEILRIHQLKKYYGKKDNVTKALDGIDFSVYSGELLGIMGASGSGKTTLLNCISTIDRADSGEVILDGIDINKVSSAKLADIRRDKIGFVFQDFNLLDTLSAYENIALALAIKKERPVEIRSRVERIAAILRIERILNKFPYQLSGGEKQRTAIARAIITNPAIILADEPSGALDSKSSKSTMESFLKLNEELGTTLLMVTHDPFTASFCNRILFIKDGQIHSSLLRGDKTRYAFFDEIIARIGESNVD